MKANNSLLNFCLPVRLAITELGASTEIARHAVNAQRGDGLTLVKESAKAGAPKAKKIKGGDGELCYAIGESVQYRYEGELNVVRKLDVFNAMVAKLHSTFPFDGAMPLPTEIAEWLKAKCVPKTDKPEKAPKAPKAPEPEVAAK